MLALDSPLPLLVILPVCALLAGLCSRLVRPAGPGATSGHLVAVDGLRGVLALGVFFHHAVISHAFLTRGVWEAPAARFYAQLGVAPVTLFFFITGFLFWSKAIRARRLPFIEFIANRARRLMPAYYASFALVVVVLAAESGFAAVPSRSSLAAQLVRWMLCGVPFSFPLINGIKHSLLVNAGVFWSLRVEWGFYLALPFLCWFATLRRFPLLIGACAVAHEILLRPALASHPGLSLVLDLPNALTKFFVIAFSIGMATAHLREYSPDIPWLRSWPVGLLIVLDVGFVLFAAPAQYGPMESLLLAPAFVAIVYGNTVFGLLRRPAFQHLGAISYSLYVLHGIVLYVGVQRLGLASGLADAAPLVYWCWIAGCAVVVIILASLSYRWVEQPFLRPRTPRSSTCPDEAPSLPAKMGDS